MADYDDRIDALRSELTLSISAVAAEVRAAAAESRASFAEAVAETHRAQSVLDTVLWKGNGKRGIYSVLDEMTRWQLDHDRNAAAANVLVTSRRAHWTAAAWSVGIGATRLAIGIAVGITAGDGVLHLLGRALVP